MLGVVACTCNLATLEAESRNGVGSILDGATVLDRWVDYVTTCNPAQGQEPE